MEFTGSYENSHPWITFELNMKKAHPRVWILIGKAMRGCRAHIGSAADPLFAERALNRRLAEAVRANAAMEGLSLPPEEIDEILSMNPSELNELIKDIRVSGRVESGREGEKVFLINIVRLYLFLLEQVSRVRDNPDTDTGGISGINQILYKGVETGAAISPGSFRKGALEIHGYTGVNPRECEYLLDRLTRGLAESRESFPAGDEFASGLIRAFIAHRYITWILPFDIGNALTARFTELQVMLSAGVPAEAAISLSSYYSRTHAQYRDYLYGGMKESVFDFMEYCLRGFVKGIAELNDRLELSREGAVWGQYLDRVFENERDEIAGRRKKLVLGILKYGDRVTPRQVRYVTPEVTLCYEGRSDKTLTRDITSLVEQGILRREGRKIGVDRNIIFPFRDR